MGGRRDSVMYIMMARTMKKRVHFFFSVDFEEQSSFDRCVVVAD